MWKKWFSTVTAVVNVGLILLAFWYGIVNSEYAHASFLLLLAMLNENTIKV